MKAIEFFTDGRDPKVVDAPKPTPEQGEVLIQTVNAAIDTAIDAVVQNTWIGSFLHSTKGPIYLGWHYSGIVKQVGDKVTNLTVGQEVFGFLPYAPGNKQGSFAEYIVVKEDACAIKPTHVSFEQAAAATTEALTALQALRDEGGLSGQDSEPKSVLIVGAGGAVGSAAVTIAKLLGAHVTAVCSTKDVEQVKALQADEIVDRKKTDPLEQTDKKFHIIFDTPAVYNKRKCCKLLHNGGTYVTTVPSFGLIGSMFLSVFTSKKVKMVAATSKQEDLQLVGKWIASGDLSIPIDSSLPARDIKEALERYASKDKKGRVVIDVRNGF